MYSFDRFVKEFFRLFDGFTSKKYVTDENRFIRDRKMNQKDIRHSYSLKEAVRAILKRLDSSP